MHGASLVALVVKNPPANAGVVRTVSSTPGSGRSPGGGHDNPLWYSFLEKPMDRRAWWAIVHRVTKSQTRLKQLSVHTHTHTYIYIKETKFCRLNRGPIDPSPVPASSPLSKIICGINLPSILWPIKNMYCILLYMFSMNKI